MIWRYGDLEIIRGSSRNWIPKEGNTEPCGEYQYLYRKGIIEVSLVYLECRGGNFMWETFCFYDGLSNKFNQRFDTKEEAEELIRETLLGDDLKDLVEWKIEKQNMIIQE